MALFSIKNNFIDSRRKAKALIYLEDIVDFAHLKLYTIDEVFDHKLSNTLLMKVIKSMPTEYSRPLQLRGLGYTYEEIAEELSIPIGTVKSSINRGRHMLKERLFLRFKVIY